MAPPGRHVPTRPEGQWATYDDPRLVDPVVVVKVSDQAPQTAGTSQLVGIPICPDLLEHSYLGMADNRRGRIVRGFFRLLDLAEWFTPLAVWLRR